MVAVIVSERADPRYQALSSAPATLAGLVEVIEELLGAVIGRRGRDVALPVSTAKCMVKLLGLS
jgi:hypothetical protein